MKLVETGITIYGKETVVEKSPARLLTDTVEKAFKSHPQVSKFVDLTLTIQGKSLVEITFIETERQRRKGYAGIVLDFLSKAADTFGVNLKLEAFAAQGTGARYILKQDELEAFYARRGFQLVDSDRRHFRWMIRKSK